MAPKPPTPARFKQNVHIMTAADTSLEQDLGNV